MSTSVTTLSTPLAQALIKAGLQAYAEAFDTAGYEAIEDLGSDEADARAAITSVIPADKPGVVNRVLALWRASAPKPKPDAQPIPDLPPGTTVDLSQPTVEVDGVEYAIPTGLETSRSETDYGPTDWMVLAKRTKILYGINLDQALTSSTDDSARAPRPALVWSVPDGDDYLDGEKRSVVTSTLSYTTGSSNLVHNRIMDASLSFGAPFVSVAARAAREERQASGELHKRLFMTGMWRYLQATIKLAECTVASPAFVTDVQTAVDQPDGQRFDALRRVFDRYGHAVSKSVTLGGELYFQSERNTTGKVSENEVKNTVSAAVSAKFAGVGGGAAASFNDGEGNKVASSDIAETVSFTCVGGDTTLGSNPKEWASTAKNPNAWAIIGRNGLVPLVEWLAPDLKAKVLAAWNTGLKALWGGVTPPEGYVSPDLDNQPFTIASIPPAKNIPTRGAMALRTTLSPNSKKTYIAALPVSLLADPVTHELVWRLVYTGKTTGGQGRGKPLYWIVGHTADGNASAVAAAIPHPDYWEHQGEFPRNYGVLLPVSEMTTNAKTPEISTACWTVARTDPSGYYGDAYDSAYVFKNVLTGAALGPLQWNDSGSLIHPEYAPKSWVGVSGDADNPTDKCMWLCKPVGL